MLTLTFPHADLGFLAWIALVPFLTLFPFAKKRQAIGYGYLLGFTFYGGVAYWMGVFAANKIGGALGIVAWVLAAAIHSPLMSLFALLANSVSKQPPLVRLFAIPAAWAAVEWFGELGTFGMGWGDLGYTQWHATPIIQITALGGVFILGYLIVLTSVAIASRDKRSIAIAAVLVAAAFLWGKIASRPNPTVPKIRVAAIQCDIDQDVDWAGRRPADPAYFYNTLAVFDDLIGEAKRRGAIYAALPETSIPGYVQFDPELRHRVARWARANDVTLLAGGRYYDLRTNRDQNVVFMVSPTGAVTGHYAKTKLVPFGEYIPYRSVFAFLANLRVSINDIQAGTETQGPLTAGGLTVGPMVCFESTYSRFARRQAAQGASILTVVTDDAWFGRTAAARQHLAMSAIRAAETHRALVRAAATGVSAIFDSNGRMLSQLEWYKRGIVVDDVPLETTMTPYTRYGNWFIGVCFVILGATLVSSSFNGRVRGSSN